MRLLLCIFLFTILFLFNCAHQVSPGGGPKDDISPYILKTQPESGALNHPVTKKIVLFFSEWVEPRNVKKNITIFPPLKDGFEIVVTGRKVEIIPESAFAESTTYHIVINTSLTDLHNVSIGIPYNFFFSTGSYIDSCIVYGCVIETEEISQQPQVALFRHDDTTLADTALLNFPSYMIQTDSSGFFTLQHLRRGTYHIIAFLDTDNDNLLSPGKDKAYAPVERVFFLESETGPLLLFPVSSDTSSNRVSTITAISPVILSGEWENSWVEGISDEINWSVVALDSSEKAPVVEEYMQAVDSRFFALRMSHSLTTGSYLLIYRVYPRLGRLYADQQSYITILPQGEFILDTIRFNGTNISDTTPPVFKGSFPIKNAIMDTKIELSWSKPVRLKVEKWYIADSLGDSVGLTADTSFRETTVFQLSRKLLPDRLYTISIPLTYIEDFSGNNPESESDNEESDSVPALTVKFTTVSGKELCYSLSGGSSCIEPDSLRIWEFKALESSLICFTHDKAGQFHFDSIPAAKGNLGCFIDFNKDGAVTQGRLFPPFPPEPHFSFPDTIEARVRWDIEGIDISSACNICPEKRDYPKKD